MTIRIYQRKRFTRNAKTYKVFETVFVFANIRLISWLLLFIDFHFAMTLGCRNLDAWVWSLFSLNLPKLAYCNLQLLTSHNLYLMEKYF